MEYQLRADELREDNVEFDTNDTSSRHRRNYLISKANKFHLLGETSTDDHSFFKEIVFHQHMSALESELLPVIGDYIDIIGDLSPLYNIKDQACIFCSFHLGSFHSWPEALGKFSVDFTVVVNEKSYVEDSSKISADMEALRKAKGYEFKFSLLNAESASVGLQMIREIKNQKSLLIYMDGNTGVGGINRNDDKLVNIEFLNRKIFARKGISSISYVTGAPIIPIVSYRENGKIKLKLLPAVHPDKNIDREAYSALTTQRLYNEFSIYLKKYYTQWEGWFYVNNSIDFESIKFPDIANQQIADGRKLGKFNDRRYGLISENEVYQLFDAYTYKAIKISLKLFTYLDTYNASSEDSEMVISSGLFNDLLVKQVIIL